MIRVALVVAVLAVPACVGDCDSVGMSGAMRSSSMTHGAMRGAMAMPGGGAAPVVGIDWPGSPDFLFESGKETAYADLDPVDIPTNFGSGTLVLDSPGGTARMTHRDPCPVGPAIPCLAFDGGDYAQDLVDTRSTYRYLHGGTGSSCYAVYEASDIASGTGTVWDTLNGSGSSTGGYIEYNQTGNWMGTASFTGSVGLNFSKNVLTSAEAVTNILRVSHGTARSPQWVAGDDNALSGGGSYTFAPSNVDSTFVATLGARANTVAKWTGHLFALACYDVAHTDAEMDDVLAAVEAVTGALPQ